LAQGGNTVRNAP